MSERLEMVELALLPGANLSLLARRFGVTRQTVHKWVARYRAAGAAGLAERSRRPRGSPAKVADEVEAAVVALRAKHPAWGGRKLAARLRAMGVAGVPAASTVTAVLRRHGLLDPAESAKRQPHRRFEHAAANDLWQMDFKGHVPMGGGGRCHPLTVLDDHSRYNLVLAACGDERTGTVQRHLTAAFRRYGLPRRMLADNGPPWGTAGAGGGPWTRLTLWLARLGVSVAHGRPGHPQTQGKEERFHRTLKAELLRWRPFEDLRDAQRHLDPWRHTYNHERPHEGIGLAVPASRYAPSPRPFPARLPPVAYDGPDDVVRRVRTDGAVKFRGRMVTMGTALVGERVALRPTRTDGLFDVCYCQVRLGRVDLRVADTAGSRLLPCRPLDPLADDEEQG